MFNKGLVVYNAFDVFSEMKNMYSRLKEELKEYGISLDSITNSEILCYIDSDGEIKTKKLDYDFIVFLDKDYNIAKMLEMSGYRVFNNAESLRICDNKMLTHLSLANKGIKMPKTITYPLKYYHSDDSLFLKNVIKELGFPMIVKELYGSLGEQVHLIKNEDDFYSLNKSIEDKPRLFQEYISTSYGKDMRVVVIGGNYVAHMERVAGDKNEFRSNIETGGAGYVIPLSDKYKNTAIKVAKTIGLDYCGLDLLFGKDDEPILLEVNANAYFSPIEKYSHINVAKAYAKHIVKTIYHI